MTRTAVDWTSNLLATKHWVPRRTPATQAGGQWPDRGSAESREPGNPRALGPSPRFPALRGVAAPQAHSGGHGLGGGIQGPEGRLLLRLLRVQGGQDVVWHVGTFHDSAGLSGSYRPRMEKKWEICVQTCHGSNMLSSVYNKVSSFTVSAIKISQESFEKNAEISG